MRSERYVTDEVKALLSRHPLRDVVSLLREGQACLVGGSLRDLFLGKMPEDFDFATSFSVKEIKRLCKEHGIKCIVPNPQHATVLAIAGGLEVEISSYRGGSKSIEEDLVLRDFTINSLAYSINTGRIIDVSGGIKDLREGVVRANRPSFKVFKDDPLRILRMVRFGSGEGRVIDEETWESAKALVPLIKEAAAERVRDELVKILVLERVKESFLDMDKLGLLSQILPELSAVKGFEQNEFHTEDLFFHTLTVTSRSPSDYIVRLAALFHDLGKKDTLTVGEDGRRHFYRHEIVGANLTKEIMRRLRFSRKEIEQVYRLVRYHMRPLKCGPSGARRLKRDLGEELLGRWLALKRADAPPIYGESQIEEEFSHFYALLEEIKKDKVGRRFLAVNGFDLMNIGIPEGPVLGEILRSLEEKALDDPSFNTREKLLKEAAKLIRERGKGGSKGDRCAENG